MNNSYYFIINPASNKGNRGAEKQITSFFKNRSEEIKIVFWTTEVKVDNLVHQAKQEGYSTIVACGGDGTIMEVGKSLINTPQKLGIISLGSGNGIARHFGIPIPVNPALELLVKQKSQKMDVGEVESRFFFGNVGLGIEVNFIKAYQQKKKHGFVGYFVAGLKAFKSFKYPDIRFTINGETNEIQPFVFMLSNTNEQGYGFSLTPKAVTNDGMLDLVFVEKQHWLNLLYFVLEMFFFKHPFRSKAVNHQYVNQIEISSSTPIQLELDGEYFSLSKKTIQIQVLPKAIDIITP